MATTQVEQAQVDPPPTDRFACTLAHHGLSLRRGRLEVLQVNVGRLCNQTCRHCHVNAGPTRTELMTMEVAANCITVLDTHDTIRVLDITGGAPEMAPPFRFLVREARARGVRVIDRCNLTILTEPGHEDLADFLAEHEVDIVASLPCYTSANVDRQRGDGVFERSIAGLRMLNKRGFGMPEGRAGSITRRLDLVYNPGGPTLPPPQAALENDYRTRLREDFDIAFDRLIVMANMPIGRFRSDLMRSGTLAAYEQRLAETFNAATIPALMCRNTLSVDHEGWLYDCDFNQMTALPLGRTRRHIRELPSIALDDASIATATHCLGCTSGSGSSCGGALV